MLLLHVVVGIALLLSCTSSIIASFTKHFSIVLVLQRFGWLLLAVQVTTGIALAFNTDATLIFVCERLALYVVLVVISNWITIARWSKLGALTA